jgi:glutaminyl-peptide cyclotransferase
MMAKITIGASPRLWLALITFAAGCADSTEQGGSESSGARDFGSGLPRLEVEVLRRLPHDPNAYTQGLVFRDGYLFESTGRYGESTLRVIDPSTGAVVRQHELPATVFGEGLAATPTSLVQVTWKELIAYYYDPATLEVQKSVSYQGEGWGLCYDGTHFYMTSGGDKLIQRDGESFAPLSSVTVRTPGSAVAGVNELECVGDHVWANIYPTTHVAQIDKKTGQVLATLDLSAITPAGINARDPDYVPNGIAFSGVENTFFITGKRWPDLLEVRFRPPEN